MSRSFVTGLRRAIALTAALFGGAAALFAGPVQALEVGQVAPDFTLSGSDGNVHTLSEMRGKWVVIAFFPKAFTKG